jgi:MoaA/NifB/PqqE/SkfB family radical SAM enzyme
VRDITAQDSNRRTCSRQEVTFLMEGSTNTFGDGPERAAQPLDLVWFELTGKCQLECTHCYADSSPRGTHGTMQPDDWAKAIDDVAGLGVGMIQFIGGEPMLHPHLGTLIGRALDHGIEVEVYSNLVFVPEALWDTLCSPGVRLATSWYTDDPDEHAEIVGRPTHARTLANIERAEALGIPLRTEMVHVTEGQRTGAGTLMLERLDVTSKGVDHVRGVGRGAAGAEPDVSALCGRCASGRIAVTPDGSVYPCVFSRWEAMRVGNVLERPLGEIVAGPVLAAVRERIGNELTPVPRPCSPSIDDPEPPPPPCKPDVPKCLPDRPHP